MRLLVAIGEVEVCRCNDLTWMALTTLCACSVCKVATFFEVLNDAAGGLHHRLLKFHLLITGESGVEQGERFFDVE
ncbi:hypothetical protein D9M70_597820 [compost metagenome]